MKAKDRELITVRGVGNFRGLGGIPANGKKVKRGLLFRSAGLRKIAPSGIETLRNLNIRHVLDLRNAKEMQEKPDKELPFADVTNFDFTQGALPGVTREEVEKVLEPRAEEICEAVRDAIANSGVKMGQWSPVYLTGGGLALNRGGREFLAAKLERTVHDALQPVV